MYIAIGQKKKASDKAGREREGKSGKKGRRRRGGRERKARKNTNNNQRRRLTKKRRREKSTCRKNGVTSNSGCPNAIRDGRVIR